MLTNKAKSYIISKIRLAWRYYSEERKDCLNSKCCAHCKRARLKLYADHIKPVGRFSEEENLYIKRMFCERTNLQPLCEKCHAKKTKKDNLERSK